MALQFSTKASTLVLLQKHLHSASILPLVSFTVAEWKESHTDVLQRVFDALGTGPWIVRSSCCREDSAQQSNAGAFLSLLNIEQSELESAIDKVISAYGEEVDRDEVLVQPMLRNVVRSGVAFSHDPNTCSPYRVINWSEGSNTTAITGGAGGRTWQAAASAPSSSIPEKHAAGVELLNELLTLFDNQPLDCEFAVTREGEGEKLWLLQARPLIFSTPPESDCDQARRLSHIHDKVARGMLPHTFIKGRRTVYGVMPDWNPAEMIGIRPKPLALSLYKELITDNIWAYQRHNYGYRNLRSFPLMPTFFGLPYIDVRLSFNSFIPADLDDNLADRLVDYYVGRLLAEPTLHDKVEFEIVFSCYTFDLPKRLERLAEAGFTKEECDIMATSLRNLTNKVVHPKDGLWRSDAAKIDILNSRREELFASSANSIERIYWLLEDAKRYGTLPFAGLARAGFIAVQILKSLVAVGVFSQDDYEAFIGSVSTVSSQLARDRAMLDKSTFLSRYGHLRPGTYDILSPRYDETPELYFDWAASSQAIEPQPPFSLTLPQMREIVELSSEHGLHSDPVGLFTFLQSAIELRESSKFHFTRNLSDVLALIGKEGERLGFSREEIAYCNIAAFKELYAAAGNARDILSQSIEHGKECYSDTLKTALPPLISSPEDVWAFEWPDAAPNFITQKQVSARVSSSLDRDSLAGTIVCISNADPGFDWVFSYPIAGLITAWGGANSHMSIRAGELGLPAVIGAGELLYRAWSTAKYLRLDCAGRRVDILS